MFKRDNAVTPDKPDRIDTVIAKGAEFKGTVTTPSGLRVDGKLEGSVADSGDVIVGEGALVLADINGRNVTIAGEVRGNVTASARLEIASTGRIIGDIRATVLVVNEGGKLDGKSEMKGSKEPETK